MSDHLPRADAISRKEEGIRDVPDQALLQWDRYLRDPSVDVAKLQALFELWERAQKRSAEAAFNAAFSAMQGELPTIDEHGRAKMPDGSVRYRYATLEDIVETVKPILQRHGFALHHRHTYPAPGVIRIIGVLSHRDGHAEEDEFEAPADTTGSKNAIQAIGSTRTYGERYTTRALLGIVSRDPNDPAKDTDGHVTQSQTVTMSPGFDAWLTDFEAKADEGWTALQAAWKTSHPAYRNALSQPQRDALKQRARAADVQRHAMEAS